MVQRLKKPQWRYSIFQDGDAWCQLPEACSATVVPTKDNRFEWFLSHGLMKRSGIEKTRAHAQRCAIKAYRTFVSTKE